MRFIDSNLNVILTSTILSGLIAAIVSAVMSLWLKNLEFRNEYYKEILARRLDAYKMLENLVAALKSTCFDPVDKRGYNSIFSKGLAYYEEFRVMFDSSMSNNLWINDKTLECLIDLNSILINIEFRINEGDDNRIIDLGKTYYKDIATLRNKLEASIRHDLLNLYDFKKFDKSKDNTRFRPNKVEDCIP